MSAPVDPRQAGTAAPGTSPADTPAEQAAERQLVAARTAPPAEPRPQGRRPREYHFPRFEKRVLPNGVRLIVAPVRKLPVVSVLAVIDAGAVADPVGSEGLAVLTARALAEGAGSSDGAALVERFERLGTALDTTADWDAATLSLTVRREHLAEATTLLGEVLVFPTFPEREVERLRQERLAEILQLRAEPRGLADEMLARFVYAEGSRYAIPDAGTVESLGRLTSGDVARFYRERYRPGAATIIMAGDVTPDEAQRLVVKALDAWVGSAPEPVEVVAAPRFEAPRVHVVAKEDAPQSEIRIGQVGLPRNHPDYFAATVMNAVLGGLFSSRINLNLREAHAYTYGAFSAFDWRKGPGPWEVSTAVQSDVTDAAAREALGEILRLREELISLDELSLATSYLDGVFPIRYETTAALAAAIANAQLYGLPDDYFDTYRTHIRAVSATDVRDAAAKHLRPELLQLVVVGDPEKVRGPLERLGFGPLTVYDAEGVERSTAGSGDGSRS